MKKFSILIMNFYPLFFAACIQLLAITSYAQNTISRDLSFAGNGQLNTESQLITLQSDDKIVGASSLGNQLTLNRYSANGLPDASFGNNGSITHSFGSANIVSISNLSLPVFQDDGKILISGTSYYYYGPNSFGSDIWNTCLTVWRFNSNGALDLSFNNTGYYIWRPGFADNGGSPSSSASCIALQADGKIIVAGNGYNLLYYPGSGQNYSGDDLTVWRLLPNGTLDLSFNSKGFKSVDYYGSHTSPNSPYSGEGIMGLKIKPSGDAVVAVHQNLSNSTSETLWGYYVFTANGNSFSHLLAGNLGGTGTDGIKDLLLDIDGDVIISKSHYYTNAYSEVKKYTSANVLDNTFLVGNSELDNGTNTLYQSFYLAGIAFQSQKIIIGGSWHSYANNTDYFSLIRLNASGTLDNTFNAGNYIFNEAYSNSDGHTLLKVYTQSTGKIIVTGTLNNQFNLRRYSYESSSSIAPMQTMPVISVYPNPANNHITVISGTNATGSSYSVADPFGRIHLTGNLLYETSSIDISKLSAGLYFLKIGEQIQQTFKLIKE